MPKQMKTYTNLFVNIENRTNNEMKVLALITLIFLNPFYTIDFLPNPLKTSQKPEIFEFYQGV